MPILNATDFAAWLAAGFAGLRALFCLSLSLPLLLPVMATGPVASSDRSYAINALTGLVGPSGNAMGTLSNVGILTPPVIFTTRVRNAVPVVPNAIGIKAVPQNYSVASIGGSGAVPAKNQQVGLTAGRIDWREIFNYQGF